MRVAEDLRAHIALMHEHTWPRTQRGGERYLHDIAWYLANSTQLVPRVVTARSKPRRDVIEGTSVERTWPLAFTPLGRVSRRWPRVSAAAASRTGRHALSRGPVSLVHAFSPNAALAAMRLRKPTVFTTVGAPGEGDAGRNPGRWHITRSAALGADVVTAVGQQAAEKFAHALGRSVLALQPGIRLDAFPARLEPRTGPPRILFPSTVTPRYKGFRSVVDALPAVLAVHPEARLVVLGPGDVDAIVAESSPQAQRVSSRIDRVLPAPTEMPRHYARGTVTILPSRNEAFGLVLAESLACGTPIVASSDGGPAEILGDGAGAIGYATAPHDSDAIAEALCGAIELAADPKTPVRCRQRAEQWDWVGSIGPRHEELYASLLKL